MLFVGLWRRAPLNLFSLKDLHAIYCKQIPRLYKESFFNLITRLLLLAALLTCFDFLIEYLFAGFRLHFFLLFLNFHYLIVSHLLRLHELITIMISELLNHLQLLFIVLNQKIFVSSVAFFEWWFFQSQLRHPFRFFLFEVEVVELLKARKIVVDLINKKIIFLLLLGNICLGFIVHDFWNIFNGQRKILKIHSTMILPFLVCKFMEDLVHFCLGYLIDSSCFK